MIDKTRLGIPLFDQHFGGIYRHRAALCIGRQGSGKTVAALQILMQSVKEGDRGLLLSAWHANDLAIVAQQMGLPLAAAVAKGQVSVLEYANIMPTPEFEKNLTLPPGSFMEFQEIVESSGIRRVVIDTVLPWVAIHQKEKLTKHIYSFIQALERMGVTAILTLPKPVSPLAFMLKNRIEEQVPIVFTLDVDESGHHHLLINKYLGETSLPPPLPFQIVPGQGIAAIPDATPTLSPGNAASRGPAANPARAPQSNEPIRFSSALRR